MKSVCFEGYTGRRDVIVTRKSLYMTICDGLTESGVAITVWDIESKQMLGRVVMDTETVSVWQPNETNGPIFEWYGMPSTEDGDAG